MSGAKNASQLTAPARLARKGGEFREGMRGQSLTLTDLRCKKSVVPPQRSGTLGGVMAQTISQLLASIYGSEAAAGMDAQIQALLAKHAPAGAALAEASGRRSPLSQRDALLITYGDQVREPGVAPLRSLGDFLRTRASDLVSGVHLLPFYPSSSDDGFSVMDYFAVDPDLGGWDDLARLGESFDLMFDAVFNHVSARGEWFQGFLRGDPEFEVFFIAIPGNPDLSQVVRPRALPLLTAFPTSRGERRVWTTFSADQVDLNLQNPRVLLAVLKALLFYVARGARFIRLDAIAYLWKEIGTPCIHLPQTHRIIQLMRAVLDKVAPEVLLITETNVPHAENLSYFGDGTNETQLVYNFALPPLVLHSLLTGSAAALNRWTASLRLPSDRAAFFNFLASHDGIGLNPARGLLSEAQVEALVSAAIAHGGLVSYKHNADGTRSPYELNITYFDALSDPCAAEPLDTQIDRFMAAHAVMLSLAECRGFTFIRSSAPATTARQPRPAASPAGSTGANTSRPNWSRNSTIRPRCRRGCWRASANS